VCIGDINRQEHQMVHGGGTMCILDPQIWTAYKNMISATWPCNNVVEESNSVQ